MCRLCIGAQGLYLGRRELVLLPLLAAQPPEQLHNLGLVIRLHPVAIVLPRRRVVDAALGRRIAQQCRRCPLLEELR